MDTHTFQARTIQEALQMVRESLGPQAIVLSTKPVVLPNKFAEDHMNIRWIEVQAQVGKKETVEHLGSEEAPDESKRSAFSSITLAESYIESLYHQEQLELLEQRRVLQQRLEQTPEQFIPSGLWDQLSASTIELNLLREVLRRVGEQDSEQQYHTCLLYTSPSPRD